jgi:Fe-S-cluster containining protein
VTSPRVPVRRYRDPLDQVWLETASRLGLRVERGSAAYATTDGRGALLLGSPETLDPDDCLAQMILHEICHWLVQGEAARDLPDWGLDNQGTRDGWREEATLRTQAVLLARHGLRRLLAPTTDWRAFYDALPENPLEPRTDAGVPLAIHALQRAERAPFAPHLAKALAATGTIARAAREFAREGGGDLPAPWDLVDDPPALHPTGLPGALHADGSCGTCAWRFERRGASRCRQADGARVDPAWPACERHEDALDCRACGACCRGAYDAVLIGQRDPVRRLHPELVVRDGFLLGIARKGDRCAALDGGFEAPADPARDARPTYRPHACTIHPDRPRICRDFEVSGEHCLTARRRVGLSA